MQQLNYTWRHEQMQSIRPRFFATGVSLLVVTLAIGACGRKSASEPPVARPSVTLNRDKAPLGSPIDLTYRFVVANGAKFDGNYRVMLHVLDANEEVIWTDDHDPPVATSEWKPGQTVEYTRTVFIPIYPYIGETTLQIGLYSVTRRLSLEGEDSGQRGYKIGTLQLLPQSASVFAVFKDGWHPVEVAARNASVEWQWTKKQATLAFKNPRKDAIFYLDLDNPGGPFNEAQQVRVTLGQQLLEEFQITPGKQVLKRIPFKAAQLGDADMAELVIAVDKTFVPAVVTNGASKDPRELGVRVFHAFIAPGS